MNYPSNNMIVYYQADGLYPDHMCHAYCETCGERLAYDDVLSGKYDMTDGSPLVYSRYSCAKCDKELWVTGSKTLGSENLKYARKKIKYTPDAWEKYQAEEHDKRMAEIRAGTDEEIRIARRNSSIRTWIYLGAGLIFFMILLGIVIPR